MIESVKAQNNGWLVNGNMSVPNDERNSDCQAVLVYIAEGGIVDDEFTAEELEAQRIAGIKAEARMKILSVMGEDAQRNSLAELVALSVTPQIEWTADNLALFRAHKTAWAMIDEIRKVSNQMEAGEDVSWPS